MPRIQSLVIPLLREEFPDVQVTSWGADIDFRKFPILNIRRVGGVRHMTKPKQLDKSVIELSAYTTVGLPETEQLYMDALEVLYDAVAQQKIMDAGYLHSIKETMGMTQFSSLYMDSWRVQGLIALGVRPLTQITRSN
jgi:hypothetical protein